MSYSTGMSYDSVLNHIGEKGPYQKRFILLMTLVTIPDAFETLLPVFTLGFPEFRCAVPGLENDTYQIQNEDHERMVNNTAPFNREKGRYSQCEIFQVPDETNISTTTTSTERCSSWVYSKEVFSSTLVTEMDLVCDRNIIISHGNMMIMAGFVFGSVLGGVVGDIFGRKRSMMIFLVLHYLGSVSLAFVRTVPVLLMLKFVVSAVGMAGFMDIFILCSEITGAKTRTLSTMLTNVGWCLGLFLLTLFAYLIRDWRTLQLAITCPMAVFLSYWWLIPESPRWLLSKGRHGEALQILKKIAHGNKVELPTENLLLSSEQKDANGGLARKTEKFRDNLLLILKSPSLIIRLLVLQFNWAVCNMAYYGLSLNVGYIIEGNLYLNFFLMAVMEMVGYLLCIFLLDRLGRKVMYCTGVLVAGVACLCSIIPLVTTVGDELFSVVLCNIGKVGITVAFATIFLFTVELFPTSIRNFCMGICSVGARAGGILSPYIGRLHYILEGGLGKALPLIVFGGTSLLAGILSLYLPETRNRTLPETMEDARRLKRDTSTADNTNDEEDQSHNESLKTSTA